jgi:hypothetical protein
MTKEKSSSDQRTNRYTIYLNDSENNKIRHDATHAKNYSNKAIAKYIREELLTSLSTPENTLSVVLPAVNASVAKDLSNAVNNLNQSVKHLNTIALSEPLGAQAQQASKMMKDVTVVNNRCKHLYDFTKANFKNRHAIAMLLFEHFSSAEISNLASLKLKREAK